MSKTANKMDLAKARQLAEAVKAELEDVCERIEIAGSVRRKYFQVGDLEFVVIPKQHFTLLGEPLERSMLDDRLDSLVRQDKLRRLKNGPKWKQFELVKAGCRMDLYLCTPETWAVVLFMRTGPADFSHQVVTQKGKRCAESGRPGLLPEYMSFGNQTEEGRNRLFAYGEALKIDSEEELFKLVGLKYLEPWERR